MRCRRLAIESAGRGRDPYYDSRVSLTSRVLIGLVAGFALGLALAGAPPSMAATITAIVGPVGTIFVNLIRMTVLPLVVSMLIASVGSLAASGALGRAGARSVLVALLLLGVATGISMLVAQPVLARVHIDEAAALALRGTAASGAVTAAAGSPATPAIAQWFIDLVPQNVFKA